MIGLTKVGMQGSLESAALQEEFARSNCVRLPGLLSGQVLSRIASQLDKGPWIENVHPGISRELLLDSQQTWQMLHFLVSTPEFVEHVEKITRCPAVKSFQGRIYRMLPGEEFQIPWHDDLAEDDGRLVGMSINIGHQPHTGGVFQIRERESDVPLHELPNTKPGDAILFRISPRLKHRVTPVSGSEPKTSFAGWFKSGGTDFLSFVRGARAN